MANVVLWPWVKVVGVIAVISAIMFGASKFFGWTQTDTKLYRDVDVPDTNWYEIKQYIYWITIKIIFRELYGKKFRIVNIQFIFLIKNS